MMKSINRGNLILLALILLVSGGIFFTGRLFVSSQKNRAQANKVAQEVSALLQNLTASNKGLPATIVKTDLSNLPEFQTVLTVTSATSQKDAVLYANFKQSYFKTLVPADFNYSYTLSQDHARLYYYKFTEIGQNSVWRVDVKSEGADPVKIYDMQNMPIAFYPSWDETYIVLLEYAPHEETSVAAYDLTGKKIKQFTNLRGKSQILGWTDAQNLLILNYPPTNAKRLLLYNAVTDQQTELNVGDPKLLGMDTAVLSPDGRSVLLTNVSHDNFHWLLYRFDLKTQNLTTILELPQQVTFYDWSSKGQEILIASHDQLWRCPLGQACQKSLLPGLNPEWHYSFWLEDTERLLMAFTSESQKFLIWQGVNQAELDLAPLGITAIQRATFWMK